jgi:hypothetical protein
MPSVQYDLTFLKAGLDELENYLLSKDVYWALEASAPRGEPDYSKMTLGWLLLARMRLQSSAKTSEHVAEVEHLSRKMDEIRARWRVAWGLKAQAEFHLRLNLWRDFVEEYRKDPGNEYNRFAYEVNRRVLLQLLEDEAGSLPATETQLLNGMDLVLRADLVPGDFVWEAELSPSFPAQKYWYLYGALPKRLRK